MIRLSLCRLAFLLASAFPLHAHAAPPQVFPVKSPGYTQSLNGTWTFKYLPALQPGADEGFHAPQFDAKAWQSIPVPANWELHGFAEPKYGKDLKDGLGLYRRSFDVPAGWNGRRSFLRFEGVAFGFEVWINGQKAGQSSTSAFNPHTFDVTRLLRPGGANLVAVKVSTKPHGFEFDLNDDWSLSGIFRDVTLFSVPQAHVQDLSTRTTVGADGSAALSVTLALSEPSASVSGELLAPNGRVAARFQLPAGDKPRQATLQVARPQLWTAETPALYRLRVKVQSQGRTVQTLEERIGLREVRIVDGVLQLNGKPIKLRGVNHHDLDPRTGRAVTEAQMRHDLALIKQANINYLRTSHYPPHPRLLELCDEMGIYVMDEVAIGYGDEHLDKPAYRQAILSRIEPTITRDKNRASVLIWSIGNENPINDAEMEGARMAKQLDPSRPVTIPKIGSYFAKNHTRIPEHVDIHAPHYPTNAMQRDYAKVLKRPVIHTEYAHALGLATDRIQEQWEFVQSQPMFAGASVWHFHDQAILRGSAVPVDPSKPTQLVWLDKYRHYDTHGLDGADGIVYADRTPQTDYWQVRKVYAPVHIAERALTVTPGARELSLTVHNRHDFRPLSGMKLGWSLQRNGVPVQNGSLALSTAARASESLRVPARLPADDGGDVYALKLSVRDEQGREVVDRVLRLDGLQRQGAARNAWLDSLPAAEAPQLSESTGEIRITSPSWVMTVVRASGAVTVRNRAGQVLVAGIQPHSGRKPTMAESLSASTTGLWLNSTLTRLEAPEVKASREGGELRLSVGGRFVRHDAPEQAFNGSYQISVTPAGALKISYAFTPATGAKGSLAEAGLSVLMPQDASEFRWLGQGPYAGYPGKDRLNEFGLFHLNRDDLRFNGNRRATELALLTTVAGQGVALASAPADVAVERGDGHVLLSHNAVIGGLGNKGTRAETTVAVADGLRIAGQFTLLPLDAAWPQPLVRWFGKPAAAKDVYRPYFHSYDQ